jgi:hypothetical protein
VCMPIDHRDVSLEEIRARLREPPLAALREMLPDDVIHDACRDQSCSWRRRVYGPVVTVLGADGHRAGAT